jgi:hypothetical protein
MFRDFIPQSHNGIHLHTVELGDDVSGTGTGTGQRAAFGQLHNEQAAMEIHIEAILFGNAGIN